jgi:RNA recognition motif-containing protein
VILFDRVTTRSRGFGFITFEDPNICQQLIQKKRIPMRVDKFVEIKESQPRETTNPTPIQNSYRHRHHMTFQYPNQPRNGSDGVMMMPPGAGASYLTTIGENFIDPSYMGMSYGSASNVVPSPSSFPYANGGTLPQPFYPSHLPYNQPMPMRDMASTPTTSETYPNMFGPSSSSPSNAASDDFMMYGEPFLPSYDERMNASQQSISVPNMNVHPFMIDGSPPTPPLYNNSSMPYYNNLYIPHPEITNNTSSPNRLDHPTISYDSTLISSPTTPQRPIYMMYPTSPVVIPIHNIPPLTTNVTTHPFESTKHVSATTFNGQVVVPGVSNTTNGDSKSNDD